MPHIKSATATTNRPAADRDMLPGSGASKTPGAKKVAKARLPTIRPELDAEWVAASPSPLPRHQTNDYLLAFRPVDGRHPGKSFSGSGNDKLNNLRFPAGSLCWARKIPVHDGLSLSRARAAVAQAGCEYFLRAELASGTSVRKPMHRTKVAKTNKPTTIADGTGRRWGMIDMDGVPNYLELDPRNPKQVQGAIESILRLMPPAIGSTDLGWEWSSSLCATTPVGEHPAELRAHFWVYLDAPMGEAAWKRTLQRIRDFAVDKLRDLGHLEVSPVVVDPKVAEVQQPLYVAVPRFVDGASDPFDQVPRLGHWVTGRSCIALADLERELAEDEAARPKVAPRASAVEKKVRAERPARTPRAQRLPSAQSIVPLGLVREARDAMASEVATRGSEPISHRARCDALFVRRALLESFKLVVARRERGEHDARWESWARDGGVPDGQRATTAAMISSLVLEAAPLGMSRQEASDRVVSTLNLLIDGAWIQDEWVGCRFESAVLDHYARASAGEKDRLGRDARYHYRATACRDVLSPADDEVVDLGLVSLGGRGRAREALRNEQAGHMVQADRYAEAFENRRRVAQAIADGLSQREAMARLGLARGAVARAWAQAEVQTLAEKLRNDRPVAEVVEMPMPRKYARNVAADDPSAVVLAMPKKPKPGGQTMARDAERTGTS